MKDMNSFSKRETGAIAIEAVIGLTFFMLSILALMLMSLIIRIEANMQYAVDQTAKELSSYYYLLDAAGVAKLTSGTSASADADVENINQIIDNVVSFSSSTNEASDNFAELANGDLSKISAIAEDNYPAMQASANNIWESVKSFSDDPEGQVKAVISVFAHSLGNKAMSYYVTPYLCRMLMPKYLSGDLESTNEYLETVGIEGGMDAVDFTYSSLLADGRTIRVEAIYKLNTKKLTFGLIDVDLIFRQTAVTAAWVTPNGDELKTIADAYQSEQKSNSTE